MKIVETALGALLTSLEGGLSTADLARDVHGYQLIICVVGEHFSLSSALQFAGVW